MNSYIDIGGFKAGGLLHISSILQIGVSNGLNTGDFDRLIIQP